MDINSLTKTTILEEQVFVKLFGEPDEIKRAYDLIALTDRAEELGVKTKFNNLLRAFRKANKEMERAEKKQDSPDNYTNFGYAKGEYYCGNWNADFLGIKICTPFGEKLACYHPILPVKRLINAETGKEKVKLAYRRGNTWKDIIVDRDIIASNTKILSLAAYGISVTSEISRTLVQFLSDIENWNPDKIEVQVSTSKLGWLHGEFIPYGTDIVFDSETKFPEIFNSVQEYGNYDTWFKLAEEIRKSGREEPLIYMAASFASVLLKPLSALPFIVNLWGDTGKGKTVAIMLATSIWAYPAESKYITDPMSTPVALEIRENILNNLPMVIDDLSKTRDRYGDNFTDIIYMLCGGKGKDRSNINLGINKSTTWCNTVLTNIERPLSVDTMRGGAVNRILDFEIADGYIFQNGNAVVETISNHYGFAGPLFIAAIKEIGFDKIREMQLDYVQKINERAQELSVEKEEKQVIPLSIMLAADKIATDYIFKDGIYLDFNKCVDALKNREEVSENERAYDFILGEVAININKFKPDSYGEYKGEVWGCIDGDYVVIQKNIFDRICERGNFSGKGFLQWAAKKELILQDGSGHNSKMKRINGTTPIRCVFLKMSRSNESVKFSQVNKIEQAQIELMFDKV